MMVEQEAKPARSAEGSLKASGVLETTGLVAGVVGITTIVFGVVLYALDPEILPLSVLNWLIGGVCVIFYAITNRKSLARAAGARSTAFILVEGLTVVGVIAGAVVLNYFAAQNPKEWDLTRDSLYSLHEQSIQVAKNLDQDVKVIGFFRSSESAVGVVTQAVELYRQHTDRIQLEIVNPDAPEPEMIDKYDLNSKSPRIVITAENGRFAKLRVPTEEGITNALVQIIERAPRRAYFLTGHGEPSISEVTLEEGYSSVASDLRADGWEVETISLLDRENIPKDATVVIVAGAKSALFNNEVDALKDFLDRGGRMMVLVEPGLDYGMDRIWRPYGVVLGDDLVLDPNPAARAAGFGPEAPVVQKFEAHPITNKLRGSAALFYRVRSVTPRVGLAQLDVTTLVQTGNTSWGETAWQGGGEYERDENDEPGPVPIGVAVAKRTSAHPNKIADEARMVVFGDMHFADNRFTAMNANRDLFLNSVNWVAGDEDRITIRPPRRNATRLPISQAEQYGIMFFSVNLLPLIIVGFGFSVWAIRRRK